MALIDGSELARLMIEHEIGVRTVETIKVQRLDLEAYEEDAAT
jgi:restriction endonuclease Mrr